jgi:hypothetical protein
VDPPVSAGVADDRRFERRVARGNVPRPVDRTIGLICDQTIILIGFYSRAFFGTSENAVKAQICRRFVFMCSSAGQRPEVSEFARGFQCIELIIHWALLP